MAASRRWRSYLSRFDQQRGMVIERLVIERQRAVDLGQPARIASTAARNPSRLARGFRHAQGRPVPSRSGAYVPIRQRTNGSQFSCGCQKSASLRKCAKSTGAEFFKSNARQLCRFSIFTSWPICPVATRRRDGRSDLPTDGRLDTWRLADRYKAIKT
jgi:hypothetical protein